MLFNKASASGPWYTNDVELLERVMKMIKQLEHLSCEEGVWELGLFSLVKRRLWGDLVVIFQYLKEAYNQEGDRLFTLSDCERIRENGFKLKEGWFRLHV